VIVALEGVPGSGKTTSAYLLARRLGVPAVCETTHDHPFIETIYDDTGRYDMQVELAFLLLHNAGYRRIPQEATVVTDYSPAKDLLFAEAMLAGRDLELFGDLYEQLYADLPAPELVLYLDASPDLCLERVRQRLETDPARTFEMRMDITRLRIMRDIYEARMAELGARVLRYTVGSADTESQVTDGLVNLVERERHAAT
jgi:deoxyguanosine kinase